MTALEAKDFLVEQVKQQAALEQVPLLDLEVRMMYFTESGEMRENFSELYEKFEAEYDMDEYEIKIGKLMRHAFWRVRKERSESIRHWKQSLRRLSGEDHYISVLWARGSIERPPHDFAKLVGTSLLVTVLGVALIGSAEYFSDRYGIHWGGGNSHGNSTQTSMPVWMQRSLLALIVCGYINCVVLPWIFKRPAVGFSQIIMKLLRRNSKNDPLQ